MTKPVSPSAAAALRRQAEARLIERKKNAVPAPATEADTQRLLHELEVHQIELEMQYEELRRAQEELQESRARYSDLYDLAPVGFLTISEQGLVLEANLAAARMLGLERRQLVRKPMTRFVASEDQDAYYLYNRRLFRTRRRQVGELRMKREGGAPFWVSMEAVIVRGDDDERSCYATLSDITARKRAEAEHMRLMEKLASRGRELETLNVELDRARAEAEEGRRTAESARRAHALELANMSQELRTPLKVIIGLGDSLATGPAGPLGDEQARALETVRGSALRLSGMIDDLNDLARTESSS